MAAPFWQQGYASLSPTMIALSMKNVDPHLVMDADDFDKYYETNNPKFLQYFGQIRNLNQVIPFLYAADTSKMLSKHLNAERLHKRAVRLLYKNEVLKKCLSDAFYSTALLAIPEHDSVVKCCENNAKSLTWHDLARSVILHYPELFLIGSYDMNKVCKALLQQLFVVPGMEKIVMLLLGMVKFSYEKVTKSDNGEGMTCERATEPQCSTEYETLLFKTLQSSSKPLEKLTLTFCGYGLLNMTIIEAADEKRASFIGDVAACIASMNKAAGKVVPHTRTLMEMILKNPNFYNFLKLDATSLLSSEWLDMVLEIVKCLKLFDAFEAKEIFFSKVVDYISSHINVLNSKNIAKHKLTNLIIEIVTCKNESLESQLEPCVKRLFDNFFLEPNNSILQAKCVLLMQAILVCSSVKLTKFVLIGCKVYEKMAAAIIKTDNCSQSDKVREENIASMHIMTKYAFAAMLDNDSLLKDVSAKSSNSRYLEGTKYYTSTLAPMLAAKKKNKKSESFVQTFVSAGVEFLSLINPWSNK